MDVQKVSDEELPVALRTLKFKPALTLLLEARRYAAETGGSVWNYAVEVEELQHRGLSVNDLRYLVQSGFAEQARELAPNNGSGRRFRRTEGYSFPRSTCFVLTPLGVAAASTAMKWRSIVPLKNLRGVISIPGESRNRQELPMPLWDPGRRMLSLSGRVIKRFRRRAVNQERVLSAFQEEEWPPRVLDPLAPHPAQVMKRRLGDTIRCLNLGQENVLIRFHGDGTGQGIVWERAV